MEWPDGRPLLEQMCITIEMFSMITGEHLAEMAERAKQRGAS